MLDSNSVRPAAVLSDMAKERTLIDLESRLAVVLQELLGRPFLHHGQIAASSIAGTIGKESVSCWAVTKEFKNLQI